MNALYIYTLKEYLKIVGVEGIHEKDINDWDDLSVELHYYTNGELWAYPVNELSYCLEEKKDICIVMITDKENALAELR